MSWLAVSWVMSLATSQSTSTPKEPKRTPVQCSEPIWPWSRVGRMPDGTGDVLLPHLPLLPAGLQRLEGRVRPDFTQPFLQQDLVNGLALEGVLPVLV